MLYPISRLQVLRQYHLLQADEDSCFDMGPAAVGAVGAESFDETVGLLAVAAVGAAVVPAAAAAAVAAPVVVVLAVVLVGLGR